MVSGAQWGVFTIRGSHLWQERGFKLVKRIAERIIRQMGNKRDDGGALPLSSVLPFILVNSSADHDGLIRDSPQRLFNPTEGASLPQILYVPQHICSLAVVSQKNTLTRIKTVIVGNVMPKRLSSSSLFIGVLYPLPGVALQSRWLSLVDSGKRLLSLLPNAYVESQVATSSGLITFIYSL